jgi:conjugative transfer signal peptidase TraF
MAIGLGLITQAALAGKRVRLVWNASPSLPVGFYVVVRGPVNLGDVLLVRLPARLAHVAARNGYLPRSAYLLKPVVAVAGDRVCRLGARVSVGGKLVARARRWDGRGRALPTWQGCHRLKDDQVFLIAQERDSFDSRYFGWLPIGAVVGRARRLWVL